MQDKELKIKRPKRNLKFDIFPLRGKTVPTEVILEKTPTKTNSHSSNMMEKKPLSSRNVQ